MSKKPRKKASPGLRKNKSEDAGKSRKGVIVGVLMSILLLTIITYSNSLNNGFISNWDDDGYVTHNPDIKDLTFSKAVHFFRFDSIYNANYHPLTMLSYAIEARLFGVASAFPFHLTNLILHLINVCLVFYLIFLLTAKLNISAIVAAFFAVHPMHVESVAWISERKDVLYAAFYLTSIIFYVKYLKGKSEYRYLAVSFLFFLLSCLSKSMAVSLPAVLLLVDYLRSRRYSITLVMEKIPYFLVALLFGILAIKSQSQAIVTTMAFQPGYVDRIFIVSYNFLFYLLMLFCPLSLSAIHYYPVKSGGMLPVIYYAAPVVWLLIIAGVYRVRKYKKEIVFGLLFFAITLSLVVQAFPIGASMVSERYTYVPYIGLLYIIGILFNSLAEKQYAFDVRRLYLFSKIMIIAGIAIFVVMSVRQNNAWKDGTALFSKVIESYPEQSHGYLARGIARKNTNDLEGALADFSSAVKFNPGSAEALNNRSVVENLLGQFEFSLRDCKEAIKLKPDYADAYNNCGVALVNQGKYPESLGYYNKATQINPADYTVLNNIGMVNGLLSNYEEAIAYCNKALKINPRYSDGYLFRGNIKQALGDPAGAVEDYSKAIEMDSGQIRAYRNRGLSYLEMKDYKKAADDLNKTISLDAGNPDDFYDLGVADYYLSLPVPACRNWAIALSKGHPQAEAMLQQYCR